MLAMQFSKSQVEKISTDGAPEIGSACYLSTWSGSVRSPQLPEATAWWRHEGLHSTPSRLNSVSISPPPARAMLVTAGWFPTGGFRVTLAALSRR